MYNPWMCIVMVGGNAGGLGGWCRDEGDKGEKKTGTAVIE